MRRVLIALFLIAASTFMAAPAMADGSDSTGSVTANDSTPEPSPSPTEESPPPVPEESPPPVPEETPPPVPEETPPPAGDKPSPDTDPTPDTDQTPGSGGSTPSSKKSAQVEQVQDLGTVDGTSAPGGGATTELCEPATAIERASLALVEIDATGGAFLAEAPNPECEGEFPVLTDAIQLQAAPQKVRICHSTSSENNPYVSQNPNASGDINGHADHTGGVFPDDPWGDIIPPFDFGPGAQFDGLNWTAEGQAIYFNDCNVPEDGEPGDINVTICHATASQNNPYQQISPSVNSIVNPNGHGTHTGPVFFPDIEEPWGDIIPPFEYGDNESFPGLNWDADGQAIYFNDCVFTDPPDEDDDDGDGDGDDGDDGDKALPNTGGQSPWILVTGGLLAVLGIAMLNSTPSMGGMHVAARGRHVKI